jgi:hypothetical protein
MGSVKLKSGATMANGMIAVNGSRANTLGKDSPLHPRNGAPKYQAAPVIAHGMKRASSGQLAACHHGVALGDEPNAPLKSYQKPVAVHPGMVTNPKSNEGDRLRGKHDPQAASAVLREAGELSRKK